MEIFILGRSFRVEEDENLEEDDKWGMIIPNRGLILISPHLSEDIKKEVLLHEILHAIWSFGAIDKIRQKDEETVVSIIASLLFCILKDNPNLITYLFENPSVAKLD